MKLIQSSFLLIVLLMFGSCSISKKIGRAAHTILLQDTVISTGHIGISIYEPATDKYWYNLNAAQYFTPASNTKLFTLYAGMKYLEDSLVAARYSVAANTLFIEPAADPTFLHPDFAKQPLFSLMNTTGDSIVIALKTDVEPYGQGWAWDDYDQSYLSERSKLPVYGNVLWLNTKPILSNPSIINDQLTSVANQSLYLQPTYFANKITFQKEAYYARDKNKNQFYIDSIFHEITIPFITNTASTQLDILRQLTNKKITTGESTINKTTVLKSQPTDSMLKPMMHNSDNFFAEQTLLMASNQHLGFINDAAIIDTLLKKDLADIPQKPTWVDGSGLSRYNLFTPQSFVYLLNKMKNEFGLERLKNILPTGGTGTFKNYYVTDSSFIYAKTGSLSGCITISGYLITRKNKLLIFSVLTNNFKGRATAVRRAVEKFISGVRRDY